MDRKLASIRRIAKLEPIEGADRIHLATVDGWKLITAKDNGFKEGDLCVYFEPDSFLPIDPRFEFLRSKSYRKTENLGEGFRLRTMKMRGCISQGLIIPLKEFDAELEGIDLTEVLKVQKYEKPIPAQMMGRVRGNFPMNIRKTDQERAQNVLKDIRISLRAQEEFEVTLKLDGSSMTVYCVKNDPELEYSSENIRIGVCSRNWDLEEEVVQGTQRDVFWRCTRENDLERLAKCVARNFSSDVALQGELMGPGVQYNREKLENLQFYLYHIWDIQNQRYVLPEGRSFISDAYQIRHVPIIERQIKLSAIVKSEETLMEDLLTYANRPSLNKDIPAEGLVFKSIERPDFSFKVINNEFLLAEKD